MKGIHTTQVKKKKSNLKIGKGPKQISFQRGHTNGQQVYEKGLSITH